MVDFLNALSILSHPDAILLIIIGSASGLFFGVLPGLGGINGVALCLPLTFGWDPKLAMLFFAAMMGASSEGGSIPAILVNTPGTIDSDYRGLLSIILINLGKENFTIRRGDRIAQMVFKKVDQVELCPVDELDETVRSAGGFGHTGL